VETGEEVPCGLLVSRGDTPEMLDCVEEPFDEVTLAVEREIAIAFDLAIGFWRDDDLDRTYFQALDEVIGVITLVCKEGFGFDACCQCLGLRNVMNITSSEAERQRISKSVNDDVDFCRQPAARAAYGFVTAPFLRAPALC
jgi:hypothetical protein